MSFDINKHYAFDTFYKREKDLTYSNRYTKKEKWIGIFGCILCFTILAVFIWMAIYVIFWQSLIWPVFIIGLAALLPIFVTKWITTTFRDVINNQVTIELNQEGFAQTIKNRKTKETLELHLPFKKMESVTMGRFLTVVSGGTKHKPGIYWLSIELAMKSVTQDGKMVLKRFSLKNPDEIQLWIDQFQQNNIPIYYIDSLLRDLTLEDYDEIDKAMYPEQTGDILLAYKTKGQKAPLNWDGKRIYY